MSAFDKAFLYHQFGYYEGSLRHSGVSRRKDAPRSHLALLNLFYLGSGDPRKMLPCWEYLANTLKSGQHVPAKIVMALRAGEIGGAREAVADLRRWLQTGRLAFGHQGELLDLAEQCLGVLEDRDTALALVNVLLGSPKVFVLLEDVFRLGRLMRKLEAPEVLWGDWVFHVIAHVNFAHFRHQLKDKDWGDDGLSWAKQELDGVSRALREPPDFAPAWIDDVFSALVPMFGYPPGARTFDSPSRPSEYESTPPGPEHLSEKNRSCRLPWLGHLTSEEQDFLTNGEWALYYCPTSDYSMGLAQWWRAVEATLNRVLVTGLLDHLHKNQDALDEDQRCLSNGRKKEEEVFLKKLMNPERALKLTLWDILLVIEKCGKPQSSPETASRVRALATNFLTSAAPRYQALTKPGLFRPSILTAENIDRFRNKASHLHQVGVAEACAGRTCARLLFCDVVDPLLGRPRTEFTILKSQIMT